MPGEDLVRLTAAGSDVEANMIESLLAGYDIPCLIRHPPGWIASIPSAQGSHEIFVHAGDLGRASEIIAPP